VGVGGRPLIAWSLAAMRASASMTVVVVAAPPGSEEEVERIAGELAGRPDEQGAFHPIVVTGGDDRAASVGHALAEVPAQAEFVAVQDAARPLVTGELVDVLVGGLAGEPAAAGVIAAVPVADTIKRGSGQIKETVDRSELWAAQTPQVFRADALRSAHDVVVSAATDDAALVEADGGSVLVHEVAAPNLKITTPADLRVAELLLG
jgi:2-C-methyl-D-erythritol 4-phosphate cytidylyltransferase